MVSTVIRALFVCPYWEKQHALDGVPLCVKQLAKSLNETGEVQVQVEAVKTRSDPLNYFSACAKFHLKSQLRNGHDIVHCHWGYMPVVVFPSHKPVVVTLEGGDLFEHR